MSRSDPPDIAWIMYDPYGDDSAPTMKITWAKPKPDIDGHGILSE